MAAVTFYLNKNKIDKRGRAPIILQFDHDKKRFKYYTGEKIDPNYWSKSKNSFIKSSYNDDSILNDYLQKLERRIYDIVRKLKDANRTISPELVKAEFLKDNNQNYNNTFFPLFGEYLKACESTKVYGTIKNYKNALHYFNEYKNHSGFDFEFERLNMAFYDSFVQYLITEKKLANNTIGRVIKILKTFLNWTVEKGIHTNLDYKKFKIWEEKIEIIYLTDQELKTVYNKEIENKALARARDLFCFGCFTGLRFSDVAELGKSNIENGIIQIRTQKTKDLLSIPLIPQAEEILKKYDYEMPTLTNQKLNKHLKELGKLCEINQPVSIQRYRGAKRIDEKIPKYDLITTHTARRTFITLSLEKGIRPEVVMSITGHKDFKSFSAYIKIVDNVKKDELLNAWK
jgi:integrase